MKDQIMPPKSPRGIQSEDVVQAADALIAEGLRPTIERVRQKIGRGSPNTVGPLLDAWFGTLAGRLGLEENAIGTEPKCKPPEAVQQAVNQLWESALLMANEEAQKSLTLAHEAIAAERTELTQRETDFEYQKQVLIARQMATDEALQTANHQLNHKTLKLEETKILLNQQVRDIDVLREKLTHGETEREATLCRNAEETRLHIEERTRLEARAMANERRLLEELDRERQETKRVNNALTELKASNLSLVMQINASTHEIKAGQQTLNSLTLRVNELTNLLEVQKMSHATTLKQLNLLLTGASRKGQNRLFLRRNRGV